MLTLTAPGDNDHDRWRVFRSSERTSCECHRDVDLAEWNADHSSSWNRLRTALSRHYPDMEYLRGVEVQGRGALHDHVILWSSTQLDVELVQLLAIAAGFGCVVHWAPCEPGSRKAAYYVSKYVTKSCDSRSLVPWRKVDRSTGELLGDEATFRTWSSSSDWGLTMREVREIVATFARDREQRRVNDVLTALCESLAAEVIPTGTGPPSSATV